MRIGLINWSGHGNLGDDAMAEVLMERLKRSGKFEVVNFGERPGEADWYILGGGTLIASHSLFLHALPNPERTIGISLGVSSLWDGTSADLLKKFPLLYVRDHGSLDHLLRYNVEATPSVDLLCALETPDRAPRTYQVANWITSVPTNDSFRNPNKHQFRLHPSDGAGQIMTSAQELINLYARAETAEVTRLHALVLAWVAQVPHIFPDTSYDEKIGYFLERTKRITPEVARRTISKHLDAIEALCLSSLS